ncbi:HD domain-containing protein [Actinomycetospora sp. TBRC 11914]|uniref:HD domain-containing protein n=1 Tax=Actinomycetospora sp. TBRC 11914 TaxID=2729387 RepID=UPI00145EB656|nr:HD domain-containing protein [Actinomycetospora sp. TBRC 11914]
MSNGSVQAARALAESLLARSAPRRWAHVCGVAKRAGELGGGGEEETDVLVCAAWLHDVGYSDKVRLTGFHPLDGALLLRSLGWSMRLCALVANHSAAAVEARFFGCSEQLALFPDERTLTRDLLWYCDMTVGPDGSPLTFGERMADVRSRYSNDDYVSQALDATMDERSGAVARACAWVRLVEEENQV